MTAKRIYHWTVGVRIQHWWHVAAMLILIYSGFYIHMPFMEGGQDTMAWMRFSHFVSMYILIFGLIFRVYLSFNSKEQSDWKELLPTPGNLAGIPEMIAYYLFMKDSHRPYKRYNPLQGLVYFLMAILLFVMAATGFALYDGWLSGSFMWVNGMLGGDEVTRVVHFLGMWVLICMTAVHIYFVLRENMLEKNRTLMSMVDGYKEAPD